MARGDRPWRAALALVLGSSAIALITSAPQRAVAHGAIASQAPLFDPTNPCQVVDQSFTFSWTDYNAPIPTGTATVDFYYVRDNAPTFHRGTLPRLLTMSSQPIVTGILEKDPDDIYTWDTSAVPSGSYWIWSYVREPPAELGTVSIVSFSPNVLTIAHPLDAVQPAIRITAPDDPYRWSHEKYPIRFIACDASGGARVRLEATPRADGTGLITIADDLPVPRGPSGEPVEGSFEWDTRCLAEGEWTLKATITDPDDRRFSAYGVYFLLVAHLDEACERNDGGPRRADSGVDSGRARDASPTVGGLDAGMSMHPNKGGCRCTSESGARAALLLFPAALLLLARRRPTAGHDARRASE